MAAMNDSHRDIYHRRPSTSISARQARQTEGDRTGAPSSDAQAGGLRLKKVLHIKAGLLQNCAQSPFRQISWMIHNRSCTDLSLG